MHPAFACSLTAMKRNAALLMIAATCATGCSTLNMVAGPGDNCRNYFAEDLVCGIDMDVQGEASQAPAPGYVIRTYDPATWQKFWNNRAAVLMDGKLGDACKGYRGPSGRTLIAYALKQRQEYALPPIIPEERTMATLTPVITDVASTTATSCEILGSFKYSCGAHDRNCSGKVSGK